MKNKLQYSLSGLLFLVCAAMSMNAPAQIDTDVTIDIDGIAILYAYTDLTVEIPTAVLVDAMALAGCTQNAFGYHCDEGSGGSEAATWSGTELTADFDIQPDPFSAGNPRLVLDNVWSVLAFGGDSADTTVSLTLNDGNLVNGGSTIALTNPLINGDTGSHSFADPGLQNPYNGNVSFELDFTNLTASGAHSSAGTYTLEIIGT